MVMGSCADVPVSLSVVHSGDYCAMFDPGIWDLFTVNLPAFIALKACSGLLSSVQGLLTSLGRHCAIVPRETN